MLAFAVALALHPLLRLTQSCVLKPTHGVAVPRESFESLFTSTFPDRFSPASLRSAAQNVGGTWTAAGLLQGHRHKVRSRPEPQPESVAMLLFMGSLEGRTGQRLFTSDWLSLFGASVDELEALASAATNRRMLVFMNAGGVKERRYPAYTRSGE